ncbi:hypothetical protein SeMB42_g04897 [Synchytrium endobioticum]|uniref:Triacylglycerol lipase n=1 Tax=Synchytrium endobioticum TaxID=286115 RepID=A0A507CV05_9FUNG|nr:hypothetical protein SeMB42_g04897 [Synchytrium endobioticum]
MSILLHIRRKTPFGMSSRTVATTATTDPAQELFTIRKRHLGLRTGVHHKPVKDKTFLAHGLFGFDILQFQIGPKSVPWLKLRLNYWGEIATSLKAMGVEVVACRVPPTGDVVSRAKALRSFLERNTSDNERVHILAHSMVYMLSHLPSIHFHVATLTTIATPHRGSSFMDFCSENLGVGHIEPSKLQMTTAISKAWRIPFTSKESGTDHAGDKGPSAGRRRAHPIVAAICSPFDTPAYANLTTKYCNDVFNRYVIDNPHTQYYSYAAVIPHIPLYHPLGPCHEIVSSREGANDGLVALKSATWGKFRGSLDCHHWDLTTTGTKFDSIGFYRDAITRLADEGW